MPEEILLERSGRVATIMLNRPDQRNAVSFDGWLALGRIAGELDNDPDVNVVVLTGPGEKAFSAGADIKDFELHRGDSKRARTYADAFDGAMDAVEALSKPTISMIRGFCAGSPATVRVFHPRKPPPLVSLAEDLEEELSAGPGEWDEAKLVDDQQLEPCQLLLEAEQPPRQ